MRSDVHFAALGAAARVAFGVTVLGGCSGAVAAEKKGDDYVANESAINAPCHEDAGAKKSCDEVLVSGLPDGGLDPWVWPRDPHPEISDEVKSCCREDLVANGAASKHRWSCCALVDTGEDPALNVGIACTPWGPPVPPSMSRRRAMGVA